MIRRRDLATLALAGAAPWVRAAAYPERQIRLVVPFAAGSATDFLARAVAGAAAPLLGQAIFVENKVGANGVIAGVDVVQKRPDGYNLFMAASSPIAIAPALQKAMPYNPVKDFTYVTTLAHYSLMLYVGKALPVASYKEYLAYVKTHGTKLNYGTGNMSNLAINSQMFAQHGLEMTNVPYKSESDALVALIAGDVQAVWASVSVGAEHVKSGRIKAIATSNAQRAASLPEVPTLEEAGARPLTVSAWAALAGPAGLPPEVVATLNEAFGKALRQPAVVEALDRGGFVAAPSTPAQALQFIRQQSEEYLAILKAAGVKPE